MSTTDTCTGDAHTGADSGPGDAVLRRIRGLLDKAEATPFPEEAEAFLAKAAELMARYHVDRALLEASGDEDRDVLVEEHVALGRGPYVQARLHLLAACVAAGGCRVVHRSTSTGRQASVLGHKRDAEVGLLLYTSLLLQASRVLAGVAVPAGVPAVTFRRAFLFGWADKIHQRLGAAAADGQRHAERAAHTGSGPSVALVLADRRQVVDDFVAQRYPRLSAGRTPGRVARSGYTAGWHAGARADLDARKGVRGRARQLGSGGDTTRR